MWQHPSTWGSHHPNAYTSGGYGAAPPFFPQVVAPSYHPHAHATAAAEHQRRLSMSMVVPHFTQQGHHAAAEHHRRMSLMGVDSAPNTAQRRLSLTPSSHEILAMVMAGASSSSATTAAVPLPVPESAAAAGVAPRHHWGHFSPFHAIDSVTSAAATAASNSRLEDPNNDGEKLRPDAIVEVRPDAGEDRWRRGILRKKRRDGT